MTSVSGSTSALNSLLSLYARTNGSSDDADSTSASPLTGDQLSGVVGMIEGGGTAASSGLASLLGQTGSATPGTDLSTIFDAIEAQKAAKATGTTTGGSTAAATGGTPTEQQKAATLMESVYKTQQSNLFTLLG